METNIPKVKVKIYIGIREAFREGKREIDVDRVSDIQELLDHLCNKYLRRQKIFEQSGQVRADVTILKNGRSIYFLDGLHTKLVAGDVITLLPAIVGG